MLLLFNSVDWDVVLDVVGFVLGLVYLFLEYKASIWLWLVGVIMPLVRSVLFLRVGVFADFGMQFFYVIVALVGFLSWRFGKKKTERVKPIRHFPVKWILPFVLIFAASWLGIYHLLIAVKSTVPVTDSFTTALCIVAYIALICKWAEQWLLWLVVDIVSTGLYIYKGIPFSACLYGFYTVMAVLGYRKWLKLMRQQ
ncbi:MAG: nicotinamide mononucleotide transporter [Muribaculaceae bacterium]|nr:nicotinamide mononucleotide transporter [Muribaculaceae bacterium]